MTVAKPQIRAAGNGEMSFNASLYTVFLCMLFGANAVAIKISLVGLGIFTTAGIRFSVAAVVILLWALATSRPVRVNARQFRKIGVLGLIFFVQLSLFYVGLSRTTASHGTLISNILPFIVLILAHFFLEEEHFSTRKLIGLVLGFSGMVILLGDTLQLDEASLHGDLIVLLAVLIWGGNAIYTKRIIKDFQPSQVTFYPVAISGPLFLIAALFWDPQMVRHVDSSIVLSMAYQTFVTASFGLIGWTMLIKEYGATTLHSYIFIMPLSGVFLGIVMLGEPLTVSLAGSIVMVTIGLVVANRPVRGLA
ncbi:MAG: DMT family transporter [Desulfofustis sp.]|nr:DMT family transporter [Desulfofustis sp.]